mmetsp:Transcript_14998/g.63276  ORF Transcript_14998/g.63276 Transcript_14998/m.63276 type:complete len:234 (+) Transcript_14998:247-948(+)
MARLEVLPRAQRVRLAETRRGRRAFRWSLGLGLDSERVVAVHRAKANAPCVHAKQSSERIFWTVGRRGGRRDAEPAGHRGRASHSESRARDTQPRPPQRASRSARQKPRPPHRGLRNHGDFRARRRRGHRAAFKRVPGWFVLTRTASERGSVFGPSRRKTGARVLLRRRARDARRRDARPQVVEPRRRPPTLKSGVLRHAQRRVRPPRLGGEEAVDARQAGRTRARLFRGRDE